MNRRACCHPNSAPADSAFPQSPAEAPMRRRTGASLMAQAVGNQPVNRRWAVLLARQRMLNPGYPSREILAAVARLLAASLKMADPR
jgi:hypothetical protein